MLQGTELMYVDNFKPAFRLTKEVVPTMGESFAPFPDGASDAGLKQDLMHDQNRMLVVHQILFEAFIRCLIREGSKALSQCQDSFLHQA